MGWQQFLNNSSLPLKQRLHGAHVAFLASSLELSTQQKEDIVILWLTQLVKEKQMSAWQEDNDAEQEQVWRLLDQIFSSQRLQQLIHKAWTCPITSVFPQSIIDVLGAPALGTETRRLVVSTACSIISTPALAAVITNSTSLSLQVTTALLDAAIHASWAQVEAERLKQLPTNDDDSNPSEMWQTSKRQKFARQPENGLLHDEKILKALSIILDDVASQLSVKNDDSAVMYCCQQLLKRMVSLEISAEAYKGPLMFMLLGKMKLLIKDNLFHSNVVAQYTTFLSFLNVEDCKAFSEVSLIPMVLSCISAIMSSESPCAASRTVSLFFEGFLHRSSEDEHRVKMLACLLRMAGVALLGDVISSDSEAFQFIERMPLDARAQENIIVALIKPLQSLERIAQGSRLNSYLVLLLRHLAAQQPTSSDWFLAIRGLLMMLLEDHTEELQASLGEVLTTTKPDEQSLDAVSDLLHDLLQHYTSTTGPVAFVSVLMQSIITKRGKLRSYKEIIPFTSSPDNTDLKVLLPPQFLGSLSSVLGTAEPLVFCDLFNTLLKSSSDLLLPLFSSADDSSGKALAGCCWVLSAVLAGAYPSRVVSVQHFAAAVMQCVITWSQQLIDPLLRLLTDQDKLDPARCCGVLLLGHAFASFLQELRSCDTFAVVWQENSQPSPPTLVPLTCPRAWASLVASVGASSDLHTRCLLLRLVLMRLHQLHVEAKRSASRDLLVCLPTKSQARHSSPSKSLVLLAAPSQAGKALDEPMASLCSTFKEILDSSTSKDALKLVRDLLSDNLLSSMHVVPSCHKAVANNVLGTYLTNPKLVQRTILGQPNLAALVPPLVQSALGRLAASLKSKKPLGGANKKRKWGSRDAPGKGEKCGFNAKEKRQKRENGGTSDCKSEVEDDLRKQKVTEDVVDSEINSHDALLAILHTVSFRFQSLEKGDDTKKINRDSIRMRQHLGHIAEVVNKGLAEAPIEYNDYDTVAQICNFFLDIKLCALSVFQIVVVLQAFLALFLLSGSKDKKQRKVILSLLRCINVCFEALPANVRIISTTQLPALATGLVSVLSRPSSVFVAYKDNSNSSLVVHFNMTLNFVLRQLVQLRGDLDIVGPVAEFLVQSAKTASAPRAAANEHRLQTAWQLVSHCAQAVKDCPGQRSAHCRAAVHVLAIWGMSVSVACSRVRPPDSALHVLSMYSTLLSLEQGSPGIKGDKARPSRGGDLKNGINVGRGNMENGTHDSHDSNVSRNAVKVELNENNEKCNEEVDVNKNLGNHAGNITAEEANYLDHLTAAWKLAEFCLSSDSASLQSCALQFLMRLKRLPPHLRPQCPDQDISNAFLAFLRARMSAASSCLRAELSHSVESSNIPISMNKKPDSVTLLDQSTLNKQPLKEFLQDCPMEIYQSVLVGLLDRSQVLDGFLGACTLGLWQLLMEVDVSTIERRKVMRAALRTLMQVLVRHLQISSPSSSCNEDSSGLNADAMVAVLEVLTSVMKQPLSLPHQAVMQVLSVVTAATCHLSTPNFALVWQKQVALLSAALVSRTGTWPGRVSGLLSAVLSLVTALAQRSSAYSREAHTHKEVLTSCCLHMEQLLRKLHLLQRDLYPVLHLTTGSIIAALQQHSVIAPVRRVLDAEIYKLLKMCSPTGINHLAVALPTETRPLLHHYRNNFDKYYAVDHTKE